MRVLLDECLPRRLKAHLVGHQVITVPEAGWAGKRYEETKKRLAARSWPDMNAYAQAKTHVIESILDAVARARP